MYTYMKIKRQFRFLMIYSKTKKNYMYETGLQLSFNLPVTLIFTPVANLLLYGWDVSTTGQFTHNIKAPSNILSHKYGVIDQACLVKMAGYWPSSFSACLWTETKSRSSDSKYSAILIERAWSIKDLVYGFQGNFSCRTQWVVPSRQDSSVLPAWVANHSAGFGLSCPLTELAI